MSPLPKSLCYLSLPCQACFSLGLTISHQTQISREATNTRDRDKNKQGEQSNLKGMEYSMLRQLQTESTITNIPRDTRKHCKPMYKSNLQKTIVGSWKLKTMMVYIKSQKEKKEEDEKFSQQSKAKHCKYLKSKNMGIRETTQLWQ